MESCAHSLMSQSALSFLPKLCTLRILNTPTFQDMEDYPPVGNIGYVYINHWLADFARYLFKKLESVDAVGIRGTTGAAAWVGDMPVLQKFFARGELIDMEGNTTAAAIDTSKSTIRETTPASSILDIDPSEPFTWSGEQQ